MVVVGAVAVVVVPVLVLVPVLIWLLFVVLIGVGAGAGTGAKGRGCVFGDVDIVGRVSGSVFGVGGSETSRLGRLSRVDDLRG